jgi:hypothetical protein
VVDEMGRVGATLSGRLLRGPGRGGRCSRPGTSGGVGITQAQDERAFGPVADPADAGVVGRRWEDAVDHHECQEERGGGQAGERQHRCRAAGDSGGYPDTGDNQREEPYDRRHRSSVDLAVGKEVLPAPPADRLLGCEVDARREARVAITRTLVR